MSNIDIDRVFLTDGKNISCDKVDLIYVIVLGNLLPYELTNVYCSTPFTISSSETLSSKVLANRHAYLEMLWNLPQAVVEKLDEDLTRLLYKSPNLDLVKEFIKSYFVKERLRKFIFRKNNMLTEQDMFRVFNRFLEYLESSVLLDNYVYSWETIIKFVDSCVEEFTTCYWDEIFRQVTLQDSIAEIKLYVSTEEEKGKISRTVEEMNKF